VDVDALFVHVAQPDLRHLDATVGRELRAHELLRAPLGVLSRRCLTEDAGWRAAPAAPAALAAAAAEAVVVPVRLLADFARQADLYRDLALVQVGHELPDPAAQVRLKCFRRGRDMCVRIENLESFAHRKAPPRGLVYVASAVTIFGHATACQSFGTTFHSYFPGLAYHLCFQPI